MSLARTPKDLDSILSQGQTRQELAEGKDAAVDFKERNAYDKAVAPAEALQQELDSFAQTMNSLGVDVDDVDAKGNDKGGNIPGVGRFESMIPNAVATDKQLTARRASLSKLANRIYTQSGKAITNSERQILAQIEGMSDSMDENQLIQAYHQERKIIAAIRERAGRNFPEAESHYNENAAPRPGQSARPGAPTKAPAQGVRVRKGGRTGTYPGTAEEAKAEGYEVIQE